MAVTGRLGDALGKRRVVITITVPMIAGLVISGLATSLPWMLVGRGLQGVSLGVVPLGISLMRDLLPPERLGISVAIMSASVGVGGSLGLPVAAIVAEVWGWNVMFLGVGGLAVVMLVLVVTAVPSDGPHHSDGPLRFDWIGAILLGAALVCLLLPVSKGAAWGWASPVTLGLFAATVVAAVFWVRAELRHPAPLVDLRTLTRPTVAWTNVASLVITFAMYVQFLVLPQVLQLPTGTGYGLGHSMLTMSLWYAPGGLAMLAVTPLTGHLERRIGARRVLMLACGVIAVSYVAALPLIRTEVGVLAVSLLVNVGVGLGFGVVPVLLMSAVPVEQTGAANGFNMVARNIGSSTAAAVIGAVVATMTTGYAGEAVPSLAGFHAALLAGAATALVALVCAARLPGRRRQRLHEDGLLGEEPPPER
jgi:predicted MFS family arabinose efflux permease